MCIIIASFADNDIWEEIKEFVEENTTNDLKDFYK